MTRQEGTTSYRPKEDGSYVTSDLEGRGDVQAVSIPSNEQRRVGARNGIEIRKQRRHRRGAEPCR